MELKMTWKDEVQDIKRLYAEISQSDIDQLAFRVNSALKALINSRSGAKIEKDEGGFGSLSNTEVTELREILQYATMLQRFNRLWKANQDALAKALVKAEEAK